MFRPGVRYLSQSERPWGPPSFADLRRLCRPEERVDVVVLSNRFADTASANNGGVFIYECERVRAVAS